MLITQADIEARLGRELTTDEQARVGSLIQSATAYITSYTGRQFELATRTKILREERGQIDLPDRPIVSITSVKMVDHTGTPTTVVPYFDFDGIYTIRLCSDYGWVVNAPEWWGERHRHTYQVVYESGYEIVPDDIKDVAINAVTGALIAASLAPSGVSALTVGDVAYRFGGSSMGQISSSISDADRDILNRYRVQASTIFYRR